MSGISYINGAIEKSLLDMHTAYLAKVLSVSGATAKIQPLGMTKATGEKAIAKSPISGVPIIKSAQNKITTDTLNYVSNVTLNSTYSDGYVSSVTPNVTRSTKTIPKLTPIQSGDIVICVCCDRDITDAKSGKNNTPTVGHHSMSDSVIVGIL